MIADCCFSGGVCAAATQLERDGELDFALACLCSADECSASTGNWTFTEAVLEVLRGRAHTDTDDDGVVSLADARTCTLLCVMLTVV